MKFSPTLSTGSSLFESDYIKEITPLTLNKQGSKVPEQSQSNENLKVVIRVRPPMAREIKDGKFTSTIQVAPKNDRICIFEYNSIELVPDEQLQSYFQNPANYTLHQFSFDFVYDQESTQQEVYDTTAKFSVDSTLQGYNSTIMAYGQTGTGKTYTMHGFAFSAGSPSIGIVPRSLHSIFSHIELQSSAQTTFMVRASYLQIYNESISDLLRPDHSQLHIREDKKRGVFVENLSEWAVRGPAEIYQLMRRGNARRATASTKMNEVSSRSHAVFIVTVEQIDASSGQKAPDNFKSVKVGKLNLVDLAGSERVSVTGATGQRLEESKKINQSLSALGNVISALTEQKGGKAHIPYRDSKITRLLEDSLGGNCKTTFMAMISPSIDSFHESLSTLKFANRAKNIRNSPMVNQDQDHGTMIRKYQTEINRLKAELEQRNDPNVVQEVELQKVREKAEEDKREVMAAYESRSREFFKEREDRKNLEEKILALESQVLVGGHKVEETQQFQNALQEQQKIIRDQYNDKLLELEKERQSIEEDKAQTDKYKQLLLKQRDIMIALTSRLNERDDTILQLQEELDAYDKIQREMEEVSDKKIKVFNQMEHLLKQNNIELPNEHTQFQLLTHQRQPTLQLAQLPTTKMILVSDPSSNIYMQTIPPQISNDKQGESLNQLAMIKNLQDELETTRVSFQKAEENQLKLVKLAAFKEEEFTQLQSESQTNQKLMVRVKATLNLIVNQLSKPNDQSQLQNIAKDIIGLQAIMQTPQDRIQTLQTTQEKDLIHNYFKTLKQDKVQLSNPISMMRQGSPDSVQLFKPINKSKVHHVSLIPNLSKNSQVKPASQNTTPHLQKKDLTKLLKSSQNISSVSLSNFSLLNTRKNQIEDMQSLFPQES